MSTSIWVGSDGFMYLNQSTFAIITPTHRRVRVSGAAWHVHDAVGMGGPGAMPEDQDTRGLGRLEDGGRRSFAWSGGRVFSARKGWDKVKKARKTLSQAHEKVQNQLPTLGQNEMHHLFVGEVGHRGAGF